MFFIILAWVGFAVVIAVAASNRGRSGFGWFLLALLISPLLAGLFVLVSKNLKEERDVMEQDANSKICPRCAEHVKTAALVCRYCGHDFNTEQGQPVAATAAPFEM